MPGISPNALQPGKHQGWHGRGLFRASWQTNFFFILDLEIGARLALLQAPMRYDDPGRGHLLETCKGGDKAEKNSFGQGDKIINVLAGAGARTVRGFLRAAYLVARHKSHKVIWRRARCTESANLSTEVRRCRA